MVPTSLKSKFAQRGAIRGAEEEGKVDTRNELNSDRNEMNPFVEIYNQKVTA